MRERAIAYTVSSIISWLSYHYGRIHPEDVIPYVMIGSFTGEWTGEQLKKIFKKKFKKD